MQVAALLRMRANVGPHLIHLFFGQHALPRRHLAPALHQRPVKSGAVLGSHFFQICSRTGGPQFLAVTRRTMFVVELLASFDLCPILGRGHMAENDQCECQSNCWDIPGHSPPFFVFRKDLRARLTLLSELVTVALIGCVPAYNGLHWMRRNSTRPVCVCKPMKRGSCGLEGSPRRGDCGSPEKSKRFTT